MGLRPEPVPTPHPRESLGPWGQILSLGGSLAALLTLGHQIYPLVPINRCWDL